MQFHQHHLILRRRCVRQSLLWALSFCLSHLSVSLDVSLHQSSSVMHCGIERRERPDEQKSTHWNPLSVPQLTFPSPLPSSCQSSRGSDSPSKTPGAHLHQTHTQFTHTYIYADTHACAGVLHEIELRLLQTGLTLSAGDAAFTHTHTHTHTHTRKEMQTSTYCLGFPCLYAPPFLHVFNTFSLSFYFITHNLKGTYACKSQVWPQCVKTTSL